MPDSYGRITKSEAERVGLNRVLYGGFCWKCGAPTKNGRTACGDGFCENRAEREKEHNRE